MSSTALSPDKTRGALPAVVPLVVPGEFIQSMRDSGYKCFASALAELIDNAFEANAKNVSIVIRETSEFGNGSNEIEVSVSDDGEGMNKSQLSTALQFGGSTRFDSRSGTGRYGMGLPNSSLSQARRVEVHSWKEPRSFSWTYFDLDEFLCGRLTGIPTSVRRQPPFRERRLSSSGTIVVWKKCDRLPRVNRETLVDMAAKQLGRVFRRHLATGRSIRINEHLVQPVDPLFLARGSNLQGGQLYGPPLIYSIAVPGSGIESRVVVRFVELPILDWHDLSIDAKHNYGISKGAGVSIMRAGRQIDYGWFFMGNKRKENYDDWWRCEIAFEPVLDELFGVAHTKQGIRPTRTLLDFLSPDIERIAHELNRRVRNTYSKVKSKGNRGGAVGLAERRDHLISPPPMLSGKDVPHRKTSAALGGLAYQFAAKKMDGLDFYIGQLKKGRLCVLLNENHPFYEKVYKPTLTENGKTLRQTWELVLLALARAECSVRSKRERDTIARVREEWSNILSTFFR